MAVAYAEVIGDPIAHSKSPLIHTFWLRKLGLVGDYRATLVAADELPHYLESRRSDTAWRGCNVTIPHKQAIIAQLDEVNDQNIAAVNCVVPSDQALVGHNTDVAGVDEALGTTAASAPVAMIGAGGAARAGLASLKKRGAEEIHIVARHTEVANELLREFGLSGQAFSFADAGDALGDCGGVINASPLGMRGYPDMPGMVLDALTGLRPGSFAIDMVYAPIRTSFLERSQAAGLHAIDGLQMLIGQAAYAFRLFFGADAPRGEDADLRALLTR